jgi:hypothetical protein
MDLISQTLLTATHFPSLAIQMSHAKSGDNKKNLQHESGSVVIQQNLKL